SLKTSIKTITYLSDTGCLEIQGASLPINDILWIMIQEFKFIVYISLYSKVINSLFIISHENS
ncbi:hypothetical protein RNO55_22300, partial [Escherichia coli]|nr:hypothetical protein [Escherichia coli]